MVTGTEQMRQETHICRALLVRAARNVSLKQSDSRSTTDLDLYIMVTSGAPSAHVS